MKHFPEEQIKTFYAVLPVHRIGFAYQDESLLSWDLTFFLQIFILLGRERRWEHDRYWPLARERAGWDLTLEMDKTKTFLLCQSKRASNLKLFAEWSHELARWKRDSSLWYMEKTSSSCSVFTLRHSWQVQPRPGKSGGEEEQRGASKQMGLWGLVCKALSKAVQLHGKYLIAETGCTG